MVMVKKYWPPSWGPLGGPGLWLGMLKFPKMHSSDVAWRGPGSLSNTSNLSILTVHISISQVVIALSVRFFTVDSHSWNSCFLVKLFIKSWRKPGVKHCTPWNSSFFSLKEKVLFSLKPPLWWEADLKMHLLCDLTCSHFRFFTREWIPKSTWKEERVSVSRQWLVGPLMRWAEGDGIHFGEWLECIEMRWISWPQCEWGMPWV